MSNTKPKRQYQSRALFILGTALSRLSSVLESLALQEEWRVKTAEGLAGGGELAGSFCPDFVLVDQEAYHGKEAARFLTEIKEGDVNPKPVCIALVPADAPPSQRASVLENGFDDFFITPFSIGEFLQKTGLYLDNADLRQRLVWKRKQLKTARHYLSGFKSRLVQAKKGWYREKNLLHNSLKQINIMAEEREQLREALTAFKARYQNNAKGIEAFIVRMIQAREERNRGHAQRVADIAVFAGEKFNLNRSDRERLKKAALLHETGLLFVPQSLLSKETAALTDYEQELLLRHPARGASLLKTFSGLEPAAKIVQYLHENVDGSGRPHGLKGRAIPFLSRILAGADLLDELQATDPTPSLEKLVVQLEKRAGARLDPKIVNCLEKYAVAHLNRKDEKVREVGIYQLTPGMVTCAGMFTVSGTKLFSPGTVLTEASIEQMMKYNRAYPLEETVSVKAE
ncbi:MAG: HD domain-containing phosphohydrolase [Desulfobacteraceae bacterium]